MSKRNFILLIVILVVLIGGAFWYFSFWKAPTPANTEEGGTNFLSKFNPFGTSTPAPAPASTPASPSPSNEPSGDTSASKLKMVSTMPIAGFTVFQKERYKEVLLTPPPAETTAPATTKKPTPPLTEFVPALRYVDRINGNIFQTFADKIDERKFSTTVIPKVYEAEFGNKGTTVVMRYLKGDNKTIQTFVGNLPKEFLGGDTTGETAVIGSFLPDNITDVSISADTLKMFYLFGATPSADSIIGTTLEFLNSKKAQIFENSFTEWLPFWANSKMITLTTKPEASVPGYMYALDPNTKNFSQVFGGINGLTTLTSPSGKLVLFGDSNLSLFVYHTDTKSSDAVGVKTLPEKCTWSTDNTVIYCAVPRATAVGGYPSNWYRGEVSFSDQIWQINMLDGTTRMIADLAGEKIDGIKLALDEKQDYLFFVNKKGSTLWELGLR